MFKKIWKDENAVSPVIATILMVAITVVLAGVLVVYMQQFSQGPGTQAPTGTSVATTFTNPYDGTAGQSNGGGWSVNVQAMSGTKPSWAQVKVSLQTSGVPLAYMDGVKGSSASAYYSNGSVGSMKWYALKAPGTVVLTYWYKTNAMVTMAPGDVGLVVAGKFETITGIAFIVIDTNGDGYMNPGDVVFVYANYAGGTAAQIITGYSLTFSMSGSQICGSNLG